MGRATRAAGFLALPLLFALLLGYSGCFFDRSGLPYSGDDGAVLADSTAGDARSDAQTTLCGNGALDQGEDCDGDDFGGQSCGSLGYASGELFCTAECTINASDCSSCGDGLLQPGEECDGTDLDGATCQTQGFASGTISCGAGCTLDLSMCVSFGCGDGYVGLGEECDGADLDGNTCASLGYTSGVLSCDASCMLDASGCDTCGDSIQTGMEDCDGTDLAGATCLTLGHDGGDLFCTTGCLFDESACADCGNGQVETGESCDGTALGGSSCLSLGFDGGSLTCATDCSFDTSACTQCGDGQLDPGEECDDGPANSDTTPDACRTDCALPSCGDGVCDTADAGGTCPADCRVVVFSDDFDGPWKNGWATGDSFPDWNQDFVDTWEPATNASHSGTMSLWCAGEGSNSNTYDNNMGAWAVHAVDLTAAAGYPVSYELWLWVDITDSDDYFAASYSLDGGANWSTLEVFTGDTGGWVHRDYDLSVAAGNANAVIGLYFYSDGWDSPTHGAYVDDVRVSYIQ